jgi:formate--tetrahydrofolate ligase
VHSFEISGIKFTKLKQETMSASKTVRKVEVLSPVPADIEIANSVEPFHISEIAKDLNLSPKHYDLYGKYKAKVSSFLSSCDGIYVIL